MYECGESQSKYKPSLRKRENYVLSSGSKTFTSHSILMVNVGCFTPTPVAFCFLLPCFPFKHCPRLSIKPPSWYHYCSQQLEKRGANPYLLESEVFASFHVHATPDLKY